MAFSRATANWRWHDGIIPYAFDEGIELSDPIRQTVFRAITDFWQPRTPLRFVLRTNEPDYILVKRVPNKERCSMHAGRQGGVQLLECTGTPEIARVAHELGHAIGLLHEHQRPDRDAMVGVSARAIRDEPQNYAIRNDEMMIGPYDFASLMHYRVNRAAGDREPMTKIHPDPTFPPEYATATSPSAGDLAAVRFLYGIVPESSPMAALSRGSDHMELWVVDADGVVRGAPFFNGAWQTWYWLFGRQFPPRAHLAAVSRGGARMEVWGVGTDGNLHGVWSDGTWRPWYTLGRPNAAGLDPGAPVVAWSRNENHMEVWVIGRDGLLHGIWFDGSRWRDWYTLGGRTFPSGGRLAVMGRHSNHMEIFAIGTGRVMHGIGFNGGWGNWFDLPGRNLVPGGGVACTGRTDDYMEVWSIGGDDRLHGIWWNGFWNSWYTINGPGFQPGSPLLALTRNSDHMEVYAVDDGDRLESVHFDGQWREWSVRATNFPRGAPLAGLSRKGDHMEVWCVNLANPPNPDVQGVQGVYFEGGWRPPYRVI